MIRTETSEHLDGSLTGALLGASTHTTIKSFGSAFGHQIAN